MELSLFIAKVMGLVFFTVGFGFICNSKYYKKMYLGFMKNEGLIFVMSILMLVLGSTLVLTHNIWNSDWWRALITAISWIILIKGAFLIIFTKLTLKLGKTVVNWKGLFILAGFFYTTLGVIFLYYGFLV